MNYHIRLILLIFCPSSSSFPRCCCALLLLYLVNIMLVSTSSSLLLLFLLLLFIKLTAVVWAGMCKCSRENNQRNIHTRAYTYNRAVMSSEREHKTFSQGNFIMSYIVNDINAQCTYSHRYTYTSTYIRSLANEKGTSMCSAMATATATMTTQNEKYAHTNKPTNEQTKKSPNGFRFFINCLHFGDLFPSSLLCRNF